MKTRPASHPNSIETKLNQPPEKVLAIIPARGGSKRIPNKNVRQFVGKPIIEYAIENALNSNIFSDVMVSTDSIQIAKLSEAAGAFVPFIRARELSDDFSNTDQVVVDAIQRLAKQGLSFDFICCIYPTTPFLNPKDLKVGFEMLKQTKSEFLLAVNRVQFPIERLYKLSDEKTLTRLNPESYFGRTQDFPPHFKDAGQFYWGTPQSWVETIKTGIEFASYIELPWNRSIDIDTQEDWEMAESLFKLYTQQN